MKVSKPVRDDRTVGTREGEGEDKRDEVGVPRRVIRTVRGRKI